MTRQLSRESKPLLFLDVDGVLNCPGPRQEEHDEVWLDGLPCYVPNGTRERVQRLLEHFDPVWCTAWLGRAHSAWRDYLGLDPIPWPYVNYLNYKLTELLRVTGERRWAYVDDDVFTYELKGLGWSEDMVPGLLIQPDHREGLTDEHVERLIAYAARDDCCGSCHPDGLVTSIVEPSLRPCPRCRPQRVPKR